jgi:ABC-type amino acid transport substrate-binding protein
MASRRQREGIRTFAGILLIAVCFEVQYALGQGENVTSSPSVGLNSSLTEQDADPAPAPAPTPMALAPGPQDSSVPWFPGRDTITVCTSEWTPAVKCVDLDPLDWTGYEIELFKNMMPLMGWTYDMIEWRCLEWDEMMDLLVNTTECDIAPAGMGPWQERIEMGLRFSVSTLQSGLSIMVKSSQGDPGRWYFFSAMDTSVWLAMVFSGIMVGIIVWLYEVGMKALDHDTKYLRNPMWDSVGRPVQMRDYRLSSTAANLVGVTWSFAVFILMALYTANLTANLTVTQINNNIQGIADLPGRAVASWSGYTDDLKKNYMVNAIPYAWDGAADEEKMVNDLLSGLVVAVVLDDSALRSMDASNCETMIVGNQFDVFDQTVGFPNATWRNYDFVDAFNLNIRRLLESGEIERLQNEFIQVDLADCKTNSVQETYSSVSWAEASGLWFILLMAVVAGLLLVIIYRIWLCAKPILIQKPWFQRWFPFMVPKSRLKRSLHTMVEKGLSNRMKRLESLDDRYMSSEDWQKYKYEGAPNGYFDGSSDIPKGSSTPRVPSSLGNGRGLSFQQIVIAELGNLRDQIAELSRERALQNGPIKSFSVRFEDDDDDAV